MPSRPFHILLVCTGNTCRSPMAEAIARQLIVETGRNLTVSSAGTSAADGDEATPEAIVAMAAQGMNLERHRSHQLTPGMIAKADAVWTMTDAHAAAVMTLAPAAKAERLDPENDIPDPYGQSLEVYEETAEAIRQALELRLRKIR